MKKSMRLSGKFNHEEAEIIKKFMEKHFQYGDAIITDDELEFVNEKYGKPRKLTANQLVRHAIAEFIEGSISFESPFYNRDGSAADEYERASKTFRKKKSPGRPRIKKKRGRPKA